MIQWSHLEINDLLMQLIDHMLVRVRHVVKEVIHVEFVFLTLFNFVVIPLLIYSFLHFIHIVLVFFFNNFRFIRNSVIRSDHHVRLPHLHNFL